MGPKKMCLALIAITRRLTGINGILRFLVIGECGVGWLNNKSRMSREVQVRFCEQLKGGEVPSVDSTCC